MAQSRHWCFTINNATVDDEWGIGLLQCLATCDYIVVGDEVGADGTPHKQGYVCMKTKKRLTEMKACLPRAHLEIKKGTIQQAADYCKKDGRFEEHGVLPKNAAQTSKEMWTQVISWAELGEIQNIKQEWPGIYMRYLEKIKGMSRPIRAIIDVLENEWWYGPTGTGKSRKLWRDFPDHYAKPLNKWWDGYEDQDVVAIEEWAPKNECTASLLKIWADRYPFPAEIKGGKLHKIRPGRLIVLSNYSPEECFKEVQDLEPIRRRFKVIHFPLCIYT